MSDPFLGQIMQVGFNYAPVGWLQCAGQSLSIAQNSALFALLGTQFGGNGTTTYNLPDFQGRVSVGSGNGAGLSPYVIGQAGGTENVSLTVPNLPAHNHTAAFASPPTFNAATGKASLQEPAAGTVLARSIDSDPVTPDAKPTIYLPAGTPATVALGGLNIAGINVGNTGNNTPVPNVQPYLSVLTIIATQGIFPSRP